jgi:outer membrane protein assembly factor BamB
LKTTLAALLLAALPASSPEAARASDWPQWGGPHRDWSVDGEIGTAWPPQGPRILWQRPLGDGYSAVAAAGDTLYTLYRSGADEVAIALEAATGKTVWTHGYSAPIPSYLHEERGVGPRSTPLVTAERVFVVGVRGTMQALDRASGRELWRCELVTGLGGSRDVQGYAASPLAWRDLVIVPAGGAGRALVALHQENGELAWRSGSSENAMTSPFLIELGGESQVVAFLAEGVAGFAPSTGTRLWQHPHPSPRGDRNISTPVFDGVDRLFLSSADGGSRAIRLETKGGLTTAREVWRSQSLRVQFTNALWRGDTIYASNGSSGPLPLTAVAAANGRILWRDRAFSRAHLVEIGERTLLLDESGTLALLTLSGDGVRVEARARLPLEEQVWTPPSVAGGRVYVRTRRRLLALELPAPAP